MIRVSCCKKRAELTDDYKTRQWDGLLTLLPSIIHSQALGDQHPDVARDWNNLGMALYARGDYGKSVEYHKKALSIMEKCVGPQHPNTIRFKKNLEMAEKAAKR